MITFQHNENYFLSFFFFKEIKKYRRKVCFTKICTLRNKCANVQCLLTGDVALNSKEVVLLKCSFRISRVSFHLKLSEGKSPNKESQTQSFGLQFYFKILAVMHFVLKS